MDKVYFSWQTGFIKPDKKAWELVLEENKLKPEEVLFCDGQEKNIKTADGLGIKTHLYEGHEKLKKFLGNSRFIFS